jgi:hypothetical protein
MAFANTTSVVTAPVKGKNVWRIVGSLFLSPLALTVPEEWKNAILVLQADAGDWGFCFSEDTAASASTTADTSTLTGVPRVITAIGDNMVEVKDGDSVAVDTRTISNRYLRSLELQATGGHLIVWRASGTI